MSFIAYLCWLLGVTAPSDCDANSYEAWLLGACSVDEGAVDTNTNTAQGQHDDAPRHTRGANINVSI